MKIVFDVPDEQVVRVMGLVAADGFDVREYFGDWPRPVLGVPHGCTRIGAERPRSFRRREVITALGAFEALLARHDLPANIVGVDTWEAGGGADDGRTGIREPRLDTK